MLFRSRRLAPEEVIEAVYPLATVHQRQHAEGTLKVVPLDVVLERQSGRYEDSAALSARGRKLAVEILCGVCVRKPVWNAASCAASDIPCPEPCSVMVALCREAALWERERPKPAPAEPAVAVAAFEQPGNELRERFLSAMIERDG